LKNISVWIAILTLVLAGVIGGGIWLFIKTNNLKGGLADFILANPDSTAMTAYTFNENGDYVQDGSALFYNADQPLVMASAMKIIILAAYADAVVNGELDPNERILISDVEKYHLPMTDGSAHSTGLRSLGIQVDDLGFARDQTAMVTLDDLARIMIHYSGNAETDYLITRLGTEKIASVMQKAGLVHHTPIRLILGSTLAAFDHEIPSLSVSHLQDVIVEVSYGDTSYLDRLIELYLSDTQWRTAQIEFMLSINKSAVDGLDIWTYQTTAAELLPKGTAREYAQLMARIASGTFISPEVSELVQNSLETVPLDWILRALFLDRFGAKDGITAGVLTLASYGTPGRGPLKGQARVVVIVVTILPPDQWAEQVRFQGHYLLAIDLIKATGLFDGFANR
jgi:D-alanyl-D-alanine carboxypeptidase